MMDLRLSPRLGLLRPLSCTVSLWLSSLDMKLSRSLALGFCLGWSCVPLVSPKQHPKKAETGDSKFCIGTDHGMIWASKLTFLEKSVVVKIGDNTIGPTVNTF